jgi:hypothetical protein
MTVIVEKSSGRIDTDLCCLWCSHHAVWQPDDRSPCADDWWCRRCQAWVEPDTCGPNALKVLAPAATDDPNPFARAMTPRELRPAC